MADDLVLNSGSGGATLSTDEVAGGQHYQRIKLTDGTPDSETHIVSGLGTATASLRVNVATDNVVTVTGSVDVAGSSAQSALDSLVTGQSSANASLDSILGSAASSAGHLNTLAGAVAGSEMQVDIVSGSVGLSGSALAFLDTLQGAVAGTEMQVDIVSGSLSLGATSEADIATIAAGYHAEDTPHSTGHTGIFNLGVRNDDASATPYNDIAGDYTPFTTDRYGQLRVKNPRAIVDTNNTTLLSPLGSSAVYTGSATDLLEYQSVTITIFADQNSTANGVQFQFSPDGTNWDQTVSGGFDYVANTSRQWSLPTQHRYFRAVFQNSGTDQTAFRLQTILHPGQHSEQSIYRADDNVAPDRSMGITKSILMGQAAGAGDFANIQTTASGNLKTSLNEISDGVDVGAGNAGAETMRVSIATDDVNLSAIAGDASAIVLSNASIETHASTIAAAVAGTEMQVDIVSGSVGLAGSALAFLDTLQGAVAGTEMQVDIVSGSVDLSGSSAQSAMDAIQAAVEGSTLHHRNIDANAETEIKGSAGSLRWLHAINLSAAVAYLHMYDATAASAVPGTDIPDFTFPLVTQGDTNGAGFVLPAPIEFSNGITYVVTTTNDGSAGDPGTNAVMINAGYV